jgi:hypothetical protein
MEASIENISKEENLQWEYNESLRREEALWRQKSRVQWLSTPDLNIRFFHITTTVRRRRNQICFLKNESDRWIQGDEAIGNTFASNFSTLFQSSSPPFPEELSNLLEPVINDEDNAFLCSISLEEEIKEALFSMNSNKSPGPNGLPPLFFKHYWNIVKREVLEAVRNFFQSGRLLKQLNHTFIDLIPKVEGAASVNQFRPISLCNVIYKIISKILASRLKLMLPRFISPWQGAFVPGRLIQDNSIIACEVINAMKKSKGKQGYMAIKLDMEKAYDRMEWSFLLKIMEKLGFNHIWITLISECISSPSFSVLINGSPYGFFSSSCGLRQGDPLSPFLFIIGAEIFPGVLLQAELEGKFQGFNLARSCPRVSHLLFVDDLSIISRAFLEDAAAVQSCLLKYQEWSGQKVNVKKSLIMFNRKVPRGLQ